MGVKMTLISIVIPCYNEVENVEELYRQVQQVLLGLERYTFEMLFIDNASTDGTVEVLRRLAAADGNLKVIVNARNFGQIRSPYHAIFQARGDAVITMCADLQDPPSLLPQFIQKWEEGYKVVAGVKSQSQETPALYLLRTMYYRTLRRLADVDLIDNFTGFGLYDRQVVETLRTLNDPYPYFRGLIAELGYARATIEYVQARRGEASPRTTSTPCTTWPCWASPAIRSLPLRLATMLGFVSSALSILVAIFYFVYKLLFWSNFELGLAPLVVGIFFFSSVQLFFLGIVGEYVGAIYTQILRRPLVIEKERINL